MNTKNFPVNHHDYYHAHVYFEQETLIFASDLCKEAGDLFDLPVGRIHQKAIGPHPKWSCQIAFSSNEFDPLITFFEKKRNGLTVFIHAVTGNDLQDHTEYAYWLGNAVELNLSIFNT